MMVGGWVSFWDCLFLGAMLNFRGVYFQSWIVENTKSYAHSFFFEMVYLTDVTQLTWWPTLGGGVADFIFLSRMFWEVIPNSKRIFFTWVWANYNDQPAEVTLNGGLVRESYPKWPKHSSLRIIAQNNQEALTWIWYSIHVQYVIQPSKATGGSQEKGHRFSNHSDSVGSSVHSCTTWLFGLFITCFNSVVVFSVVFIYAVFFVAIKVQWPRDEHDHSKEDRNMFFALLLPTTWRMGSHLVSMVKNIKNHGDRKSP